MPTVLCITETSQLLSRLLLFMKSQLLWLLLGLTGCHQPASQSAYAAVVADEAIRLAGEYCQHRDHEFSWLRRRIDTLENAPYQHQQFVYVFRTSRATFFAVGPADLSRLTGPLLDCQGQPVPLRIKLNGTIIYTPPAYRRSTR